MKITHHERRFQRSAWLVSTLLAASALSCGSKVTVAEEQKDPLDEGNEGNMADDDGTSGTADSDTESANGDPEMDAVVLAGCERNCGFQAECGDQRPLPVGQCDCSEADCGCSSVDDCVVACMADVEDYRAQSSACGDMIERVYECVLALPCEGFRASTAPSIPECEGVQEFDEVCELPEFGCSYSGTAGVRAGSNQEPTTTTDCEMLISCGDVNYGHDCILTDTGDYRCTCREDGEPRLQYTTTAACDGPFHENLVNFRCDFPGPPMPRPAPVECDGLSAGGLPDGAPTEGACNLDASCGDSVYALSCAVSEPNVACECLLDGEVTSEFLLDSYGCNGVIDPNEDPIWAMNLLCGWNLQGDIDLRGLSSNPSP